MNSRWITVQGIKTRVNETGSGQPVLFVHGNPDSADLWNEVIRRLPPGFRTMAVDLPGFGQAAAADGFDWSIANRGQWVADVLDALDIDVPVNIVGHDHGGVFTAAFAVKFPERINRLVLQNTLFHADYEWHLFGKLWRTPLLGEYLAFWQPFRLTLPISRWYMKKAAAMLTNAYIADLQKTWTQRMGRAMLAVYRASDPKAFDGWQQNLYGVIASKPTLVLWGDHDYYLPVRLAEDWAAHGAKLIRFADAGHWLAVEKPDEYAAHLAAFFEL